MTPIAFIHDLRFEQLPPNVVARAKQCLLDLIGVAAAGTSTELSRIVRDHAVRHMGASSGGATLLFDGRRASVAGAAFAAAFTIDSFDAHDGHALTKGHAGVAVLPTLMAFAEDCGIADGRELLTGLVLGYEIATRAGIALHVSVPDYHTSGAWNALACAAIGARFLRLDHEATRHALGIAEYHGPRSQMMRCIAHPTMLKDGSGWGAYAGVTAAFLAQDGFTGAPALTVEAREHLKLWGDLGTRWRVMEQYFKPHPVCRWAQPAIEAAASLVATHQVSPDDIRAVEIRTFEHAIALGAKPPSTTEEAQYAIGFPVASLLAKGRIGDEEISPSGLCDENTLALLGRISLREDPAISARFPAERLASVTLDLASGARLSSPVTAARGDPDDPLPDEELRAKFDKMTRRLPERARQAILRSVEALDLLPVSDLTGLIGHVHA